MALSPPTIALAIQNADPTLTGINWKLLTMALGIGVYNWTINSVKLQGTTAGVAGTGSVNGKMVVTPASIIVPAGTTSVGLVGIDMAQVALAVGTGVATAFSTSAQYTGASAGVGVGGDFSLVSIAEAAPLTAQLVTGCTAVGFTGIDIAQLMAGFGVGISGLVRTGFGIGAVAGSPSPVPAAGTSLSTVF